MKEGFGNTGVKIMRIICSEKYSSAIEKNTSKNIPTDTNPMDVTEMLPLNWPNKLYLKKPRRQKPRRKLN